MGSAGPGNHVPAPVAPQWVPTSFTIAGLIQGLGPGASGRRGLLLWIEMSEGDLRLQKMRPKAEIRKRRVESRGPPRPGSQPLTQPKPSLAHWDQGSTRVNLDFSFCCHVTNYHKPRSLEQHAFTGSHFCR